MAIQPIAGYQASINHLRAFLVVAEELNFRRAADRLYITSSPLSRQIKELEEAVGAQLFERDTRHVRLTDAGARLIPMVRDAVERLDAIAFAVRCGPPAAVIRVGVAPGVHPSDRVAVMEAVTAATPQASVVPRGATSDVLVQELHRGELDLALVHSVPDEAGVGTWAIRTEEYAVAVSVESTLAALESVELRMLPPMKLVTTNGVRSTLLTAKFLKLCRAAGIEQFAPKGMVFFSDLVPYVSSGGYFVGVTTDPESPLQRAVLDPQIAFRRLADVETPFETLAAWISTKTRSEPSLAISVEAIQRAFPAQE